MESWVRESFNKVENVGGNLTKSPAPLAVSGTLYFCVAEVQYEW